MFKQPVVWFILVLAVIWWASSGFPPVGFPNGEYVCTARSGAQEYPISVFNPSSGPPMKVFEYRPGEEVEISRGMSYSHSTFSTNLNLYLGGDSYFCARRS